METLTIKKFFYLLIMLIISQSAISQEYRLNIYSGTAPGFIDNGGKEQVISEDIVRISHVQTPDIAVYLPSKKMSTGQAVIICPGGAYHILAYDYEGSDIARYLNSIGVAGIVLKYRLPVYGNCEVPHKVPLMDAQRAMRLVRSNASKWHIDPYKIGIMGFSAGGHLASTLGTHFDYGNKTSSDPVEKESCRPDFMILMYPVISFTELCTHKGSREALLGKDPDPELMKYYSNELQVKKDTPPAFIVHADDDSGVSPENSILMYRALQAKKISAELHIVSAGEHGFGLSTKDVHTGSWTYNLKLWLDWLNEQHNL